MLWVGSNFATPTSDGKSLPAFMAGMPATGVPYALWDPKEVFQLLSSYLGHPHVGHTWMELQLWDLHEFERGLNIQIQCGPLSVKCKLTSRPQYAPWPWAYFNEDITYHVQIIYLEGGRKLVDDKKKDESSVLFPLLASYQEYDVNLLRFFWLHSIKTLLAEYVMNQLTFLSLVSSHHRKNAYMFL